MGATDTNWEKLREIRMFVLDMDGTIYLGDRLFPYTPKFLQQVRATGRDFCFFTNNSSKNKAAYLEKLANMGICIPPEKMLLSNEVILQWLQRHHPGARCYVVGTPPLLEDFRKAGFPPDAEDADLVVLGSDPLQDIRNTRDIRLVLRAGQIVFDRLI